MRDIRKEILEKLAEIEEKENVKVLYAVESGSRCMKQVNSSFHKK